MPGSPKICNPKIRKMIRDFTIEKEKKQNKNHKKVKFEAALEEEVPLKVM
jgi:hypothetical protein